MADFDSSLPVYTRSGKYVVTKLSDGTETLGILTVDSAYGATPNGVPVVGKYENSPTTYADGDATPFLMDSNGRLQVALGGTANLTGGTLAVDITGGTVGIAGQDAHDDTFDSNPIGIGVEYETLAGLNAVNAQGDITRVKSGAEGVLYTDLIDPSNNRRVGVADADANNANQLGFLAFGDDGANYRVLSVDANGQVQTAHDANTNPLFTEITDSANELDISVAGAAHKANGIQVMGSDGTNATRLLTDTGGRLKVNVVSEVSSDPVHDYDTTVNVAGGGNDNHDYGNTTGGSFRCMEVEAAASGAMKVTVSTLVNQVQTDAAVGFTSMACPTTQLEFPEPIMVPAGGTLRVNRENRENNAMDVYSYVNGYSI